jgi:hypothetical protein
MGIELGLEMAGVEVELVAYAEIDKYAAAVAASHHPDVPNLGDIKVVDWAKVPVGRGGNEQLAQAMYDRYCQGKSVAEVAEEFGRSRQSVWKMFDRRGWDMRQRPPARPFIDHNGRRFSLRDNGYYAATDGDRELLHRVVWREVNGSLPDDWDVHHIDHDKTNNDPSNLQAMPKADHTRLHAKEVVPTDSPTIDILTAGYP